MSTTPDSAHRGIPVCKYGIWIIIAAGMVIVIGQAIVTEQGLYLGLLLIPALIYLSVEKPFIFPFGVYAFLLPFDQILAVTESGEGATVTKFLGIFTILILFFKGLQERKMKWPDNAALWWVLFIAYGAASFIWAFEPAHVMSRVPTAAGLLILYLVVSSFKITQHEFVILKWFILLGGCLSAVYAIYSYAVGFDYQSPTRATMALEASEDDPNNFAFSLLIPFAICIEMFLVQKRKMPKAALASVLGIILLSIILTGSRGGLLAVGIIIIVYLLGMKQRITITTIAIIAGILIVSVIPSFFLERWKEALETGGAGRTTIWHVGLEALSNFWIVGAGLNNFPGIYREFANFGPFSMGLGRGSHNIYLGILVELGIGGFFLLVWGMRKHYKAIGLRFAARGSTQVMLKAAFWGILVASFFLDTLWTKSFWLLWTMILMQKNISNMKAVDMKRVHYPLLNKERKEQL